VNITYFICIYIVLHIHVIDMHIQICRDHKHSIINVAYNVVKQMLLGR